MIMLAEPQFNGDSKWTGMNGLQGHLPVELSFRKPLHLYLVLQNWGAEVLSLSPHFAFPVNWNDVRNLNNTTRASNEGTNLPRNIAMEG